MKQATKEIRQTEAGNRLDVPRKRGVSSSVQEIEADKGNRLHHGQTTSTEGLY
jgi:hypothetical protein